MALREGRTRERFAGEAAPGEKQITGLVIGRLAEVSARRPPWVEYPGSPDGRPATAVSTVALVPGDVGREVALAFEGGDPGKPIVLGLIHHTVAEPADAPHAGVSVNDPSLEVHVDGERIRLTAREAIELRCGEASLTLTRSGRVQIRGTYLLSRSSGVNRIKGGSVQIN